MADVKGLLADPRFNQLDPATQKHVLGQVDQRFATLSDEDYGAFRSKMGDSTPQVASPPEGFLSSLGSQLITPQAAAGFASGVVPGAGLAYGFGQVNQDKTPEQWRASQAAAFKQRDNFLSALKSGNYAHAAKVVQDALLGEGLSEPADKIESQLFQGDYQGALGTGLGFALPAAAGGLVNGGTNWMINKFGITPQTALNITHAVVHPKSTALKLIHGFLQGDPEAQAAKGAARFSPPPITSNEGTFANPTAAYRDPFPPPPMPGIGINPPVPDFQPPSPDLGSGLRNKPSTWKTFSPPPPPAIESEVVEPNLQPPPMPPRGFGSTPLRTPKPQPGRFRNKPSTPKTFSPGPEIAPPPAPAPGTGGTASYLTGNGPKSITDIHDLTSRFQPPPFSDPAASLAPDVSPTPVPAAVPPAQSTSESGNGPMAELNREHARAKINRETKNAVLALHMHNEGVTPEQFSTLTDEQVNNHIKGAKGTSGRKYDPLGSNYDASEQGRRIGRSAEDTRRELQQSLQALHDTGIPRNQGAPINEPDIRRQVTKSIIGDMADDAVKGAQ